MSNIKEIKRSFRHKRIRRKMSGTAEQPRLCLHRSLKNLSACIVDDTVGKVLLGMSTLAKDVREKTKNNGGNIKAAEMLGEALAKDAIAKGIRRVAFDRGGYMYHGRIKAFADAARKAGLEF
ncbi:MAG: 50S ribosomal protein L18 [Candidatus Omnitrophica bacterium]|nr:50S ribosomal protein L18 [Candidatus Omnitrophota bacterium]